MTGLTTGCVTRTLHKQPPCNQPLTAMKNFFRISLPILAAIVTALLTLCACGDSTVTADECLNDAAVSINEKNWNSAQTSCDHILSMITGTDSVKITESQAARLGILFMKLSEHVSEAENVADAVTCLRYAFRLSADSLNSFSATLQPEDERHFVLLRRLAISIDNPIDLSAPADTVYTSDLAE